MRCAFCDEKVDLNDPEVFSLVARWDNDSPPLYEDAIHRTCLSNGRTAFRRSGGRPAISLVRQ